MADSKHKPNPLPCGCSIKGTSFINASGDRMEYRDLFIDFCALHAAAPELLEVSKMVAHPKFTADEQGKIRYYVTKSDIAAAREAIRKAEGVSDGK